MIKGFANKSTHQPVNQLTFQPFNQLTFQPINQSTNQPVNSPTRQPVNQSENLSPKTTLISYWHKIGIITPAIPLVKSRLNQMFLTLYFKKAIVIASTNYEIIR